MPSIASRAGKTVATGEHTGPVLGSLPGAPSTPPSVNPPYPKNPGVVINRGIYPMMVPGQAQQIQAEKGGKSYFQWEQTRISPVVARVPQNIVKTAPKPAVSTGQPFPLLQVSASSEPFKTATGEIKCLVSVSYLASPPSGARIWFLGYHGSATMELVSEGTDSPVTFLCDPTGETVTIYGEAVSDAGVLCKGPVKTWSPKTTLTLSGVTDAPPAPSMAQNLVGTPTGYQFEFNQLAGQLANVIDGYAIYRNTTDSQTSATQIAYIKQNPKAQAPILFRDVAAQGQAYYYFVSAVDTSGNESALTNCQTGTIIPLSTFDPTGKLWGPSGITGVSAAPMTLQQVHDTVAVTQGSIALQNANFEAGNVGWLPEAGWQILPGPGYNGSPYRGVFSGVSGGIPNGQQIPCVAGDVISGACQIEGVTGATGSPYCRIRWYDINGNQLSIALSAQTIVANVGWQQARVVATAPANTAYARIDCAVVGNSGVWICGGFKSAILANSLDEVPDGPTYKRVTGVVGGQTTTQSYSANSVSASIYTVVNVLKSVGTSPTLMTSTTATTQGGYVKVSASATLFNQSSTQTDNIRIQIYKGNNTGTLLWDTNINGTSVPPNIVPVLWAIAPLIDTLPGASQEYSIYASCNTGDCQMDEIILTVENMKA